MNLLDTPLARIVQQQPGATAILNHYGLSFCCGGKDSLKQAIENAGLNETEVLKEFERLPSISTQEQNWHDASDAELIAHILQRYHQVHREQLVELFRLADRVETVHAENSRVPKGLAALLEQMANELFQHMEKEENILFPMLSQGNGKMMGGPIHVMQSEHAEHELTIKTLKEMTDHFSPPKGACNTWRALYVGLEAFVTDLERHIELENTILFARQ